MLEELHEDVLPEHRRAIEDELARLDATVATTFASSPDLDRAGVADTEGMGGEMTPRSHAVLPALPRFCVGQTSGRTSAALQWLAALLIAAVSNFDNLGVGIACGARGTRIDAKANLVIAAMTMAATGAAVTIGGALFNIVPAEVSELAGPLIIIVIGLGTVRSSVRARWYPGIEEADHVVSLRDAIVLGVALSINNLATGVGAGAAGIPAVATTASAGVFSLVFVEKGSRFGKTCGQLLLGRCAPLVAGIVLVALGLAMLPELGAGIRGGP
jgi:putative Mn2+ efflux pump MntP